MKALARYLESDENIHWLEALDLVLRYHIILVRIEFNIAVWQYKSDSLWRVEQVRVEEELIVAFEVPGHWKRVAGAWSRHQLSLGYLEPLPARDLVRCL